MPFDTVANRTEAAVRVYRALGFVEIDAYDPSPADYQPGPTTVTATKPREIRAETELTSSLVGTRTQK